MVVPPRAIDDEDKAQRAAEILDAAQRLLEQDLERMPSVADVAREAGLAKGTVYLYYSSKEQLLLALHERNSAVFFGELEIMLQQADNVSVQQIFDLCWERIVEPPTFMPLAALCLGQMNKALSFEQKCAFHESIGCNLQTCGTLLERHFPTATPGAGAAVLMRSYAVIVGLWQLMQPNALPGEGCQVAAHVDGLSADFRNELETTLKVLWFGHMQPLPDHF